MFGFAQLAGAHCYVHIGEPCKSEKRAFLKKGYAVLVCLFIFVLRKRDLEKIGNRICVCDFCVTTILQQKLAKLVNLTAIYHEQIRILWSSACEVIRLINNHNNYTYQFYRFPQVTPSILITNEKIAEIVFSKRRGLR